MPKIIKDEFTDLKITAQYRWQLRKLKAGLCSICGKYPDVYVGRCLECLKGYLGR